MYLQEPKFILSSSGMKGHIGRALYLILIRPKSDKGAPIKAITRKVAMHQTGIRFQGPTRIGPDKLTVGGYYGRFGNICFVSDEAYEHGTALPAHLFTAYINSANGEERELIKAWASENLEDSSITTR